MEKRVIFAMVIGLILIVLIITYFIFDSNSSEVSDDKCLLEPDAGLCKARMPKYYFDNNEEICKKFFWGGCGGVVPFETLEECQSTCE